MYVKVFIGEKILLSRIVQKEGGIQKMNAGKWGAPIATIVRVGESPEDAFKRASLADLGVVPEIISVYPRTGYEFENSAKKFVYEFDTRLKELPANADQEFCLIDQEELKDKIKAREVAETYMKLI